MSERSACTETTDALGRGKGQRGRSPRPAFPFVLFSIRAGRLRESVGRTQPVGGPHISPWRT
jgi:hypothetical protein